MKISDLPIEQTYGYHVFDGADGKQFEPKLETDEFCSFGHWEKIQYKAVFFDNTIYRRKIDVCEGYKLIGLDDPFRDGDEVLTSSTNEWIASNWHKDFSGGVTPRIARQRPKARFPAARRKISVEKPEAKPDANGWFLIKENPPKIGQPIWAHSDRARNAHLIYNSKDLKSYGDYYTHWQPAVIHAPPVPQKSADEIALEEAMKAIFSAHEIPSEYRKLWSAALEHARKGNSK